MMAGKTPTVHFEFCPTPYRFLYLQMSLCHRRWLAFWRQKPSQFPTELQSQLLAMRCVDKLGAGTDSRLIEVTGV